MRGFIDENGFDKPPCGSCKYRNQLTISAPCYNCISIADLSSHRPNYETEFAAYVPRDGNAESEDNE